MDAEFEDGEIQDDEDVIENQEASSNASISIKKSRRNRKRNASSRRRRNDARRERRKKLNNRTSENVTEGLAFKKQPLLQGEPSMSGMNVAPISFYSNVPQAYNFKAIPQDYYRFQNPGFSFPVRPHNKTLLPTPNVRPNYNNYPAVQQLNITTPDATKSETLDYRKSSPPSPMDIEDSNSECEKADSDKELLELRAFLLKSLVNKKKGTVSPKKEKEQIDSKANDDVKIVKEVDISSNVHKRPNDSPSRKVISLKIPKHPKLIIQNTNSSDEEVHENKNSQSLDDLIKSARLASTNKDALKESTEQNLRVPNSEDSQSNSPNKSTSTLKLDKSHILKLTDQISATKNQSTTCLKRLNLLQKIRELREESFMSAKKTVMKLKRELETATRSLATQKRSLTDIDTKVKICRRKAVTYNRVEKLLTSKFYALGYTSRDLTTLTKSKSNPTPGEKNAVDTVQPARKVYFSSIKQSGDSPSSSEDASDAKRKNLEDQANFLRKKLLERKRQIAFSKLQAAQKSTLEKLNQLKKAHKPSAFSRVRPTARIARALAAHSPPTITKQPSKVDLSRSELQLGVGVDADSKSEELQFPHVGIGLNPSTRPNLPCIAWKDHSNQDSRANSNILESPSYTEQSRQNNRNLNIYSYKMNQFAKNFDGDNLVFLNHLLNNISPKNTVDLHFQNNDEVGTADCSTQKETLQSYRSALLMFRSYRLSPWFGLSTLSNGVRPAVDNLSFTHQIDPNNVFCVYDLHGVCKLKDCAWQHARDYTPSKLSCLRDIASYRFADRAVDASTLDAFIREATQFKSQELSCKKGMHLVIDSVNFSEERQGYIVCKRRKFNKDANLPMDDIFYSQSRFFNQSQKNEEIIENLPHLEDSIMGIEDSRYFCPTVSRIQMVEEFIINNPNDTKSWIRLAKLILSKTSSKPNECLEEALSALSRALEVNHYSKELWLMYLRLYFRQEDASNGLQLCKESLVYVKDLAIFYMIFHHETNVSNKEETLLECLEFLKSDEELSTSKRSHYTLQCFIHLVQLRLLSHKDSKNAQILLRNVLIERSEISEVESTLRKYLDLLNIGDGVALWLSYLHIIEFMCLPSSLVPLHSRPFSDIPQNKIVHINWQTHLRCSLSDLVDVFEVCKNKLNIVYMFSQQPKEREKIMPYYDALALLFASQNIISEAYKVYLNSIKICDFLISYIFLIFKDDQTSNALTCSIQRALSLHTSPCECYHRVYFEIITNFIVTDTRLADSFIDEYLTRLSPSKQIIDRKSQFSEMIPITDSQVWLGSELSDKNLAFIWCIYCFHLECRSLFRPCVQVYERALAFSSEVEPIAVLRKSYASMLLRWCESGGRLEASGPLISLLRRSWRAQAGHCPLSSQYDVLIHLIPSLSPSSIEFILEQAVGHKPSNILPTILLLLFYLKYNRVAIAEYTVQNVPIGFYKNLSFVKVSIALYIRTKRYAVAKSILQSAVKYFPFSHEIWMQYALVAAYTQTSNLEKIVQDAKKHGVDLSHLLIV